MLMAFRSHRYHLSRAEHGEGEREKECLHSRKNGAAAGYWGYFMQGFAVDTAHLEYFMWRVWNKVPAARQRCRMRVRSRPPEEKSYTLSERNEPCGARDYSQINALRSNPWVTLKGLEMPTDFWLSIFSKRVNNTWKHTILFYIDNEDMEFQVDKISNSITFSQHFSLHSFSWFWRFLKNQENGAIY